MAVDAAAGRQAEDVVLLDIQRVSAFADYFVICTGTSTRHLNAIVEAVDKALAEAGEQSIQREGTDDSGWVLLDFGDVIVHVFAPEQRSRYQLEKLWANGTIVLRIQ